MTINWPENFARKGHELFLSGLPIALHCHHYNLNLQKTLETSLGDEGALLLYQASEESSYAGFTSFLMHHPKINTVKSKLELAATSYQYCGLGIINFTKIGPDGGRVVSPHSHHVTGWLAKFGKRETPGCLFSRGWIAGVLAVIYDKHATFQGVRSSWEWAEVVEPMIEHDEDQIHCFVSIAVAFGWGDLVVRELIPDEKLVIHAKASYEAKGYLDAYGKADAGKCYMLRGVAAAFMDLVYGGDYPDSCFQYAAEETHCQAKGDPYCEFVARKTAR